MMLRLLGSLVFLLAPASSLLAIGDLCVVCGKQIADTVYLIKDEVAGQKKPCCGDCVELTTVCYLCGVPVKNDLTELSDGRILCARDAKSVVLDEGEVRRICGETKEALDRNFSRFTSFPDTNITIAVADRVSLLEFFKMPGNDYECPNVLGYIQTRTNRSELRHDISLLSGLLPGVLRATYAHECTHAWIAENVSEARKATLARDAGEGFCELVAYLTMGAMDDAGTQRTITRNAYTRGQIALLIEAEQRFGFNEVVDWMKNGEDSRLIAGEVDRVRRVVKPQADAEAKPARATLQLQTAPVESRPELFNNLVLQGITWAGAHSLASINNRTFAPGEVAKINLGGSNVTIRCLEIRRDSVVIQPAGTETTTELKLRPPL